MTTAELRNIFHSDFNVISQKNGIITVKKSYYWGVTKSGEIYANRVKQLLPTAKILGFGNHWVPFRGGAKEGGPQDSYFYVKFTLEEN